MMFRASVLAFLSSVAATSINPADITATSKLGSRLLSKAKVIQDARHLDQERDMTFVAAYSLRYLGCSSLVQVRGEEGGGEDGSMLYTQQLVRFALCPTTETCASCSNGGEYVVSMMEFVDLYTEHKLNDKEWACEMIRENCYCDNANDDEVCENQCYVQAGMQECIEYEGEEEFEIQRYLECQEMEGGNDNNNNNNNNGNYDAENYYGNYYVGPYCSPDDGKSIFLGVFYDEGCTAKADNAVYAKRNYGVELPFSSEPLVDHNECISCEEVDRENDGNNNNNGDDGNDPEIAELCEQSYEMAARCEENMEITYKDSSGCTYINSILPRLDAASRKIGTGGGGGKAGKAFSVIFAFTTVLFAGYAYFLYRKIKRGSVNLSAQE